MNEQLGITKLALEHDPTDFDCDSEELNSFIRLYAFAGQRPAALPYPDVASCTPCG